MSKENRSSTPNRDSEKDDLLTGTWFSGPERKTYALLNCNAGTTRRDGLLGGK
ncbi:unnamed protein product, partial [Nesidiocoris tenuis]